MASHEDLDEVSDVNEDGDPFFLISEGGTYFKRKKEQVLFGDFYMKIIGEITEEGVWVCSFGAKVLGRLVERRIVVHPSAFDSRVKFLDKTRKSFGGGTFNLTEGGLLEMYHSFLKEEYYSGTIRRYFAASCIGQQTLGDSYWCLSREIHIYKKKILQKEQQRYLFLDDSFKAFEISIHRHLLENRHHLCSISKRFLEACDGFLVNTSSMKLATAFVLSRLLKVNNEESWNESSIGMLHSSLAERNVGKSLTMDILAKAQGVPSRKHPTMLAGGDQSQSGTSVPILRDMLSKTNLVVMVDDPVFSCHLGEFIVNLQNGLMMGSRTAGVTTPGGSLLLTSNDNVIPRAEGRVLVFNYVRGAFSSNDENVLETGIKSIVNKNIGFLLAWAILFKDAWEESLPKFFSIVKDILSELLPELQPRWLKGMTTVILTHAIFHASVGLPPKSSSELIKEIVKQNKPIKKVPVITRLQQSLVARLADAKSNPLSWLNPAVNVSINGKFVPAVGVRSSVLDDFAQVSCKEVNEYLKSATDTPKSMSIVFAVDEACSIGDLQSRTSGKVKGYKGLKVPKSHLNQDVLAKIGEYCGVPKGKKSCAGTSTCTPSSATASSTCTTASTPESDSDSFAGQLMEMDDCLLNFFQGYQLPASDCEPSDINSDNLSLTMSPGSKKEYDDFSPHSKRTFKKGFDLASRMLGAKQSKSKEDATPSTSGLQGSRDAAPRKRQLFPEGSLGVLPRQGKSSRRDEEEQEGYSDENGERCHVCGLESPKKKKWSRKWIECDACKSWTHLECSKRKTLPTSQEPFHCVSCEEKGTSSVDSQ